jgi:O-antigen ligase
MAGVSTAPRRIDAVTLLTAYVFLLMIIPSSLVVGSFGAAGAPASLFAAILLCWYMLARQHPGITPDRGPQPVRVAGVFFGCAILAAYVAANRTTMPVLQQNGADRGLIVLSGWLGVLLLAADGIDRADRLEALLGRIVMGATAMAALGMIEFFTGVDATKYVSIPGLTVHTQFTDLMNRDGLVRAIATAAQPLEFAAVLAMSLPLAIHQARSAPPALRARRWLRAALIAGALPMTVSRSAIFGLAVTGVVLFPTWPKRERRRAYVVLLASFVIVWLVKPSILGSFGGRFGHIGTDTSIASRTGAYSAAAPFIAEHPWFGHGFETFFPQMYFFVDNEYLTSLIETGVVGLLALLALFATGWFTARSARLAAADAQSRDLAQCLAASVAAAAVCFGTFDALSFSIAPGLCFLLLGCVGAAWRLARAQQQSERAGGPWRRLDRGAERERAAGAWRRLD